MMGIFSRKSKCPKCNAALESAGSPCPKCDWGHIVLSLEPAKAVNAPNIMANIYVSDDLIRRINDRARVIKERKETLAELKEIHENPERCLTLARCVANSGRFYHNYEAKTVAPISSELFQIMLEWFEAEILSLETELEQLRTGELQ